MKPTELKVLTLLRSCEPFNALETIHLRLLASIATETEFTPGKIVYETGDRGTAVYLIEHGLVVIEIEVADYGLVTLYTCGPGKIFGWSSLFPERRKKARARVVEPTKVVVFNTNQLRDLFRLNHRLENDFMSCITKIVIDRVYATRHQLSAAVAHRERVR